MCDVCGRCVCSADGKKLELNLDTLEKTRLEGETRCIQKRRRPKTRRDVDLQGIFLAVPFQFCFIAIDFAHHSLNARASHRPISITSVSEKLEARALPGTIDNLIRLFPFRAHATVDEVYQDNRHFDPSCTHFRTRKTPCHPSSLLTSASGSTVPCSGCQ